MVSLGGISLRSYTCHYTVVRKKNSRITKACVRTRSVGEDRPVLLAEFSPGHSTSDRIAYSDARPDCSTMEWILWSNDLRSIMRICIPSLSRSAVLLSTLGIPAKIINLMKSLYTVTVCPLRLSQRFAKWVVRDNVWCPTGLCPCTRLICLLMVWIGLCTGRQEKAWMAWCSVPMRTLIYTSRMILFAGRVTCTVTADWGNGWWGCCNRTRG